MHATEERFLKRHRVQKALWLHDWQPPGRLLEALKTDGYKHKNLSLHLFIQMDWSVVLGLKTWFNFSGL